MSERRVVRPIDKEISTVVITLIPGENGLMTIPPNLGDVIILGVDEVETIRSIVNGALVDAGRGERV